MSERASIYLAGGAPGEASVLFDCLGKRFLLAAVPDGGEALRVIAHSPAAALLITEEAFAAYPGDFWGELRRRGLAGRLPVFLLAAEPSPEREAAWLHAGAADVLRRPLCPPLVLQRVRRLVELYGQRGRLEAILKQQARQAQETRNLKLRAAQDCLTKLRNRDAAESEITAFLQGEGQNGTHAFLLVDVDDFKRVNDTLGHLRGDAVLCEIAAQLKRHFRIGDIIGRIGGDEFVILMKNAASQELAAKRAGEVCRMFHGLSALRGTSCAVGGSVGVAMFRRDGSSYRELFQKADLALYAAKRSGKDSYYFYRSGLSGADSPLGRSLRQEENADDNFGNYGK